MIERMYDVKGMTCAACISAVEKASLKTPGVIEANANLPTEQIRLITDDSFDEKVFFKNVTLSGYKATRVNLEESLSDKQKNKLKVMKHKILLSLVFLIPLLIISMGPMIGIPVPSFMDPNKGPIGYALAQLILTIPVMVIGYRYYVNGFKNIFRLNPNMDSLIAIGTTASFLYGVYGLIEILLGNVSFAHKLYFESSAVILVLVMVGKYLEQKSTTKTTSELEKLMDLKPKTALLFDGNTYLEVSLDDVKPGNLLMVRPGDLIPTDGIIKSGISAIDESMMTGESMPVDKVETDFVIGGTVNISGSILIEVTHIGEDTVLSSIIKRVSEAQMKKAPIQKLADTISGFFVPVVFLIAIITFALWMVMTKDFNFSINIFVSILVIACPCALGLATPTAIMTSSGVAAKHGILIASGEALEVSSKVGVIAFDKTGTITMGKPKVIDVITTSTLESEHLIRLAASLEVHSNHPIALAIKEEALNKGYKLQQVENFENLTGFGIKGFVKEEIYFIGNEKWMIHNDIKLGQVKTITNNLHESGKTSIYVAKKGVLLGIIVIADPLRPETKDVIKRIKEMGIQTVLISGDDPRVANHIGNESGFDKVYGSLLPHEKQTIIKELKEQGRVMMVGDGINDAIALKEADIGVSLSSGTDVAMSAGDVVLMRHSLEDLITLIDLSNKTVRNIKENLFWAFIYNLVGIPIAMGLLSLFGGPLLNPMFAALAMSLSSFSVVLNALRLKRYKGVR